MRIAILTDDELGKDTGVTTTLQALLRHAPLDLQPHVYALASHSTEGTGYTTVRSRRLRIPFHCDMRVYAPPLGELRERFRSEDVQVIHLTNTGSAGLAARRLAHALGLPLVGSYHTELGEYMTRPSGSAHAPTLLKGYVRWVYARCRRVLVPSQATGREISGGSWPDDRVRVWTRGVDSDLFSPVRRSASLRESWRASLRSPAILYVLRESSEKELVHLVRVQRLLADHGVPHRWVFASAGPISRELRQMLPDALFAGAVSRLAMAEIMASADVSILSSGTDRAACTAVEAQAAGLPVLVTDRGGLQEHVIEGVTGYICRAGDERDFAWRLAQLLVDAGRRRTMSEAARRYAVSRGWAHAMQPVWACYRDALHTPAMGSVGPVPPTAAAHVS